MPFTCPYCQHEGPPNEVKEGLNGGGWAVFIILILFVYHFAGYLHFGWL